ncbi:MAG: glycosyltransferase family 9 protein [Candidatus Coatesbacteria bacterium]|nr:glycosyltransferase family 9 protein [Candidatus Coatesbacteria bacterium]
MTRYIYRRRGLRIAAGLFDAICGVLCKFGAMLRSAPAEPLDNLPINPGIAFIRLDGIGDVMAALPAAEALKARFPKGTLMLVVRKQLAEALKELPFVDEVLTADFDLYGSRPGLLRSIASVFRIRKLLKALHFDVALEPRGDPRVIIAVWSARIPLRIGVRSAGAGFLLSASIDYQRDMPETEHNLRVAALLGAEAHPNPVRLTPDATIVSSMLERHPQLREPFLAVHPSASIPTKTWPQERFAEAIHAVASKYGLSAVLVGGSDDVACAEAIGESCRSPTLNLAGKTDLRELIALLSQARLFIGSDSGPAHLAARVGIPTAIVFGGTNDASVWRPPGVNVAIISHSVDCSPCELRSCPNPECLLEISVGDVLCAVDQLLAQRTGN